MRFSAFKRCRLFLWFWFSVCSPRSLKELGCWLSSPYCGAWLELCAAYSSLCPLPISLFFVVFWFGEDDRTWHITGSCLYPQLWLFHLSVSFVLKSWKRSSWPKDQVNTVDHSGPLVPSDSYHYHTSSSWPTAHATSQMEFSQKCSLSV